MPNVQCRCSRYTDKWTSLWETPDDSLAIITPSRPISFPDPGYQKSKQGNPMEQSWNTELKKKEGVLRINWKLYKSHLLYLLLFPLLLMTSHYFCLWIFFHGETWKVHCGMVPKTVTQYNTVTPPVSVVQIRISVAVGLSGPTSKHRSFVRYQEDQPKWRWQLVSFFKDASFLSHLCHFFLHIFAVSQLFYHSCFCCLLIIVFCPLHQPACSFPFNNIHSVQLDMTCRQLSNTVPS